MHVHVRVPIFGFPTFRQQPPKSTQHAPAAEFGRILATARSTRCMNFNSLTYFPEIPPGFGTVIAR